MPSTVVQRLFVEELPPGLYMTITDVKVNISGHRDWEVEFDCYNVGSVSINKYTGEYRSYNSLSDRYPITVALEAFRETNQGQIGVVTFGGYKKGCFSGITGTGGQVDITIRIQGSVNADGNSYDIDETGCISVSTTEWKGVRRPDYTNISYNRGDEAPIILQFGIFPLEQPADACLSYRVKVIDENEAKLMYSLNSYS